jgi:hypothetical protein
MTSHPPIHQRALVAGLAVIVITNAIALGGAAYNRAGDPDATLTLSERELTVPYNWGRDRDNSGLVLHLNWRALGAELADTGQFAAPNMLFNRMPAWLDSAKFASLGFRMTRPANTPEGRAYYRRQVPKQVLLVMEMNGKAAELMRARIAEWAARQGTLLAADPSAPELSRRARSAGEAALREERVSSRLFIVDAGRDRDALRRLYPDRTRYAIVRGAVRPQVVGPDTAPNFEGYVTELAVEEIYVPHRFRTVFDSVRRSESSRDSVPASPFAVAIAFGRRLEPWVESAVRRP